VVRDYDTSEGRGEILINIWAEASSTQAQIDRATQAGEILTNLQQDPAYVPNGVFGTQSWLEEECLAQGILPFDYTCSNRVNVLVLECGFVNAFVSFGDSQENFPYPADGTTSNNNDIIFYMCQEYLDVNPNPFGVGNTFAHELDHVIQGGFGQAAQVVTEGGATYLESQVLGLPFRPLVYAYGFPDWNDLLAAHLYEAGGPEDRPARKFYQLHQAFLTYLSQPGVLGQDLTTDIHSFRWFQGQPYGREIFEYFMQVFLTVLTFLSEIVLAVLTFLTEIVLTVLTFLSEIVLAVLTFLTKIVLTVLIFPTEIVLTVLIVPTGIVLTLF
jgi:hypothetical protein